MTTPKKTASKATPKPKAPPKPKFGEVGFKFPIMVEIVKYLPDNNDDYPVVLKMDLGNFEDIYWDCDFTEVMYDKQKDFKDFYTKCDPKFAKAQKQEQLKQAKALVVKLEKELAEIK